ncbi:hypothetical protein PR202_gb09897 [Eleusine coracana subsp. coracana]|uniref:LMBR1-like membrane protein n=1 Tax=Eleusine coracana subsp. coracana TaxID=191504 RepID=A0AAV5EJ06_ELECO|nr:hypothetical protein PR202_gb09897 [Eleusine coracana subsp. coracana]
MWVFYLISLPLTLGMVVVTLRYFAGPAVPRYVVATVGYAWFCSLSFIILVPADIWTTLTGSEKGGIGFFWSWSYWSTFILTWAVVPTIQGYEDAGDFTVKERLKTSIHMNLLFYSIVGAIGLIGLILLLVMHRAWDGGIVGFAMACSNTFGLVTGAFLLGFGLSEIPRNIWKNAEWSHRQKVLSHRVAKMAVKLDSAHQEYSNAIVIAQATSNQMSKRDLLRPYMDIIDNMVAQMLRDDPSFKPSGGRLGENDMDYDTDDKSMATLRRQLRRAHEEYYRCKSEYMTCVMEALELEDTIKNYERRDANGWKYVSSFRESRSGTLGSLLDTIGYFVAFPEFIWRCILRKQLQKAFAIILGCMSAAILLAEATLLPSGVDLSLFSILIKAVGRQEVLVQRMGNIDDAVPFFGRGFNRIYPLIMRDLGLNKDVKSVENIVEMETGATSSRIEGRVGQSKYANNRETIASKYSSIREQNRQATKKELSPNSVSLLQERNPEQRSNSGVPPGSLNGVSSTWASMKTGFQNFKANMGSKKFLPLRQDLGYVPQSSASSPESLDDIFQRLKRRPANMPVDYLDDDDDDNTGDMDLHFQDH